MIKYLYILIGVLLVAAAGVFMVGYLVRKPTASNTGATPNTGISQPVNNYTVGVSGNAQTATSASQTGTPQTGQSTQKGIAPDFSAAYGSIFIALNAQQLSFTRVQSASDPTFGGVYALYKNDIAIAKSYLVPGQDTSLAMVSADLNQDGMSEVIVYEDLPGFCGNAGCELDIYAKSGGGWKKIYGTTAAGEVGVLSTLSGGYHDLALGIATGDNPRSIIGKYTWGGSTYSRARTLAVWNGQQFVPYK